MVQREVLGLGLGMVMRRREFIMLFGNATTTWPLVALAQKAGNLARMGFLGPSTFSAGGGPTVAPYGSWKSPITSDIIAQQSIKLSETRIDGDKIYWLEERPDEDGRCVVVRWPDRRELKKPYSARSQVHDYDGGAWTVDNGNLYFSNSSDGGLYRYDWATEEAQPLTPAAPSLERNWRYADGVVDRAGNRWLGVREDHTSNPSHPENTIVAVPLNGPVLGPEIKLAVGHDFYSSPRLSPDGKRLAWLAWDQPNMPWTSTTLYMVALDTDGVPTREPIQIIADGAGVSLFQPEWSPDGSALYYVSDESGWWNLYCYDLATKDTRCLKSMQAEFARAQWYLGMSMYAFAGDGQLVAAYVEDGLTSLARLDLDSQQFIKLDLPFTEISSVRADAFGQVVFCAGAPNIPTSLVRLDLRSGKHTILKQATNVANDPKLKRFFSSVKPVKFKTKGGETAFGLFYPPANPDFAAPKGSAAALGEMPRRSNFSGFQCTRFDSSILDQSRHRCGRRELSWQYGVRSCVSKSIASGLGHS